MATTFEQKLYEELGNFDSIFDTAGAFTGSQDEFFKQLGKLAGKVQANQLTVADASEFKPVFEQLARVYETINARIRAFPLPPASEAGVKLKAYFNGLALDARYQAGRLASISQQVDAGDLAAFGRLGNVASEAFKNLGGFFALIQTGIALFDGGVITQANVTSATGKAVGFYIGLQAGTIGASAAAAGTAVVIAGLGLAASPILIGASAIAAGALVGYAGGKFGEELWKQAHENYETIYLPKILDGLTPSIDAVKTKLADVTIALGKRDGTWLENLNVSDEAKTLLSGLVLSPSSVPYSDTLHADIKKLFIADFTGDALAGRDILLQTILTFAKDNGYATERVTASAGEVTLELPSFSSSALNKLRDYVGAQLSSADQSGWALTGPGRIVAATTAGTHASGSTKDTLIIGSDGVDGLIGGAGNDDLIGGKGQDTLLGGAGVDNLFGGEGDDFLDGGAGGDWLYGGAGNDTYQLKSGELFDIIEDSDGTGTITVDGVQLTGGKKADDNYWVSTTSDWGYLLTATGDLIVSKGSSLDKIVIRNWQSSGGNQLGIVLDNAPAPIPPKTGALFFNGDQRAKIIGIETQQWVPSNAPNFGTYAWSETAWANDGKLTNGIAAPDFFDVINASAAGSNGSVIHGYGGNDALSGSSGDDDIFGDDGDDLIGGGAGSDNIRGGDGNDFINSSATLSVSQRWKPTDSWSAPVGKEVLAQGAGWGIYVERVYLDGSKGYVWSGANSPSGDDADVVDAGAGNDSVITGGGNDRVQGGTGDDELNGMGGNDILEGDDGNDLINGDGVATLGLVNFLAGAQHGSDYIDGGAGNDTLRGNGGNDEVYGGAGNDTMFGDEGFTTCEALVNLDPVFHGNDYMDGEDGDDYMEGGGKDDTMYGGAGNDVMLGDISAAALDMTTDPAYWGNDYLDGEDGNDELVGGGRDDTLYGGSGDDLIWGDFGVAGLDAQYFGRDYLDGEDGNDYLIGGGNDDILYGGAGDDVLKGDDDLSVVAAEYQGDDYLDGEDGNDILLGGGGNDILIGGAGNDYLDGGTGADYMEGGAGDDVYVVDNKNDVIFEIDAPDAQGNAPTPSIDYVLTSVDYELGHNLDNLTLTGTAAINGTGNALRNLIGTGNTAANVLIGNVANNILNGGAGADTMMGGMGNDTYVVDNVADVVVESLGEGIDLVQSSVTYTLAANVENLTLTGSSAIKGTGNALDNVLMGNSGANVLTGGAGNDTYIVGSGDTTIEAANGGTDTVQSAITWTLAANVENLVLTGSSAINGTGNASDNVITGNSAANVLTGGAGNDTYIVGTGDTTIEAANGGTDTVQSAITWTLASEVENLILTGTAAINGTGNASNNIITGNSAANTLSGAAGDDKYLYNIGGGADRVIETTGNDRIVFGAGITAAQLTATRSGSVVKLAVSASDSISFDDLGGGVFAIEEFEFADGSVLGASWLNSRFPNVAPTATNLSAAETYTEDTARNLVDIVVTDTDSANTTVVLTLSNVAAGSLSVATSGTVTSTYNAMTGVWTASGAVANVNTLLAGLTYTPSANFNGNFSISTSVSDGIAAPVTGSKIFTGVAVNDAATGTVVIAGTAAQNQTLTASNTLADVDGLGAISYQWKAGGVAITGATGSTLVLGSAQVGKAISVTASFTDGRGTLESATSVATAAVIGSYVGTAGADTLSGSTGADWLSGLAGNDTYVVNNAGDLVFENLNEGIDLVQASVTYTLAANVENLTLTGTAAINGTGNALNNVLTGNSAKNILTGGAGDDILDGKGGADTMVGGAGNDVYYVDIATDVVTENANEGTDTVNSSVTLTLSANVENLTLTGTTAINGTGNALDNVLIGNSAVNTLTGGAGNDTLNGGAGADKMLGGLGNDTYVVDNTGDLITENANEGTDSVQSSVTYTLVTNVENLTLTGTSAVNGTGNAADNVLIGNSAANTLTGNAGNDTLDGQGGNDILVGGTGNDTYWLGRGYGVDNVTENDATAGNTDVARFDATVSNDQLWFTKTGNNLEVSIIGTSDKLVMSNWYLGSQYHVEQFKTSNGKTLLDSQVQNLVSAMSAFSPPAAGQTTLPANYATSLSPVIVANWQ